MEMLANQVGVFAATFLIGMIVGFCYDYYRVLRGICKLKKIGTFLGDTIFWLAATVLVLFLLILGNWGVVRWYIFIGIGLGALLYFQFFGGAVRRLFRMKFRLAHRLWQSIARITRITRR